MSESQFTDEKIWRAFYTRPRHEKKAADRLEEAGFDIYCPVVETKVRWSDRLKRVKKPLFTSYVFARVEECERLQVVQDPSIVRTVMWLGKPAVIRDEEIEAIRVMLGEVEDIRVEPICRGDQVRVDSGSLRDMYGVVVKVNGNRARLRLQSLQCDVTFSVRTAQLEKLAE